MGVSSIGMVIVVKSQAVTALFWPLCCYFKVCGWSVGHMIMTCSRTLIIWSFLLSKPLLYFYQCPGSVCSHRHTIDRRESFLESLHTEATSFPTGCDNIFPDVSFQTGYVTRGCFWRSVLVIYSACAVRSRTVTSGSVKFIRMSGGRFVLFICLQGQLEPSGV